MCKKNNNKSFRNCIILISSILFAIGMIFFLNRPESLVISRDVNGLPQASSEDIPVPIKAWEKDNVYYFFMPAYIKCETIKAQEGKLWVDSKLSGQNGEKIPWTQIVTLKMNENDLFDEWQGKVCFVKSANIASLYLSMADESFEKIYSDKEAKCVADISLIKADGKIDYESTLEYISSRGNSSWSVDKKSHTLKLKESYPLLGMDSGKKWVLLANVHDGTKMLNKMTADIATQMGMEYVQQTNWVDLYINGEYQGNYLLAEKIEVDEGQVDISDMDKLNALVHTSEMPKHFVEETVKGYETDKNPANISGGYLIEKDFRPYYDQEACGFLTNRLYPFTIKHPSIATRAEVEYISDFVKTIDDKMATQDETVLQLIDRTSFYRKFLLDEISLNKDSNITSAYFYKNKDEDILYAGPLWDYDEAYGEARAQWLDYTKSVLDISELRGSTELALDWYNSLYAIENCQKEIVEEYERILPIYEYYLSRGIDDYYHQIYQSVTMDMIRWDYGLCRAGYYTDYTNIVRYLKYFLYCRLEWLNERWNVDFELTEPITTNAIHEVYVEINEDIYTLTVKDGDCISRNQMAGFPQEYEYEYVRDGQSVNYYMPVFEPQYIIAK